MQGHRNKNKLVEETKYFKKMLIIHPSDNYKNPKSTSSPESDKVYSPTRPRLLQRSPMMDNDDSDSEEIEEKMNEFNESNNSQAKHDHHFQRPHPTTIYVPLNAFILDFLIPIFQRHEELYKKTESKNISK